MKELSDKKVSDERTVGRGVVKRRRPAVATKKSESATPASDVSTAPREKMSGIQRAKPANSSAAAAKRGLRTEAGTAKTSRAAARVSASGERGRTVFFSVGGETRRADLRRMVLLGGDAPRPRGRAPGDRPWWDSIAAEYVAAD